MKLTGLAFGNGLFAVAAVNGVYTPTSGDSGTWTRQTTNSSLEGLTFADGKFVAVGQTTKLIVSADGANWQDIFNWMQSTISTQFIDSSHLPIRFYRAVTP